MSNESKKSEVIIIGIAGPSGSGKSTQVRRVAASLENSETLFYDTYKLNYDKLTEDLGELRKGNSIISPERNQKILPKKYWNNFNNLFFNRTLLKF